MSDRVRVSKVVSQMVEKEGKAVVEQKNVGGASGCFSVESEGCEGCECKCLCGRKSVKEGGQGKRKKNENEDGVDGCFLVLSLFVRE